jgi:hypothetical protein
MGEWLVPAVALTAVIAVAKLLERMLLRQIGRSTELRGAGRALVGLGVAASVLTAGAILELSLPWLAFVAGASSACIGLAAQLFFGKQAP